MKEDQLTTKSKDGTSGVQVITRAAAILRAAAQSPRGLSLGELARELDLAKSTVQRIVGALAEEGLLIAPSTFGGARLGPEIMRLALAMEYDVCDTLRPYVHKLSEKTEETIDVAILDGGSAVFVDQIPGSHRLRAVSAVGERFPLTDNAPGMMLLALSEPKAATAALRASNQEHPEAMVDDLESFWKSLAKARKLGYVIDNENHSEGISAVGTAVLDQFGRPVAVSIPVPTTRFKSIKNELVENILEIRTQLENEFNYLQSVKE